MILQWLHALMIVCTPFVKIVSLWIFYQLGMGYIAWSTARFYSINCAAPGLAGYISSLLTMGSPICISAWISHTAFVAIYIASFIGAVIFSIMWFLKKLTNDKIVKDLQSEINSLNSINTRPKQRKWDYYEYLQHVLFHLKMQSFERHL